MDDDQENDNYNIEELESMLYSKIHHDEEIFKNIQLSTPLEDKTVAVKPIKNRYWNQSEQSSSGPNSNSKSCNSNVNTKAFNKKSKHQFKKKLSEIQNDSNLTENQGVTVTPFVLKPFTPYKPIMENSRPSNAESTKSDSNNANESDNTTTNKVSSFKDNIAINNGIVTMKNVKRKNKLQSVDGPFKVSKKKLEKLQKLHSKKNKAAKSRNATKKHNASNQKIQIISLDTSEESESEDVIEIKLPPPPLVTIDDSSDEQTEELSSSVENNFAKPKDINFQSNKKQQQDSSRCTTPCSFISDDFIGQTDRTSLLLSENQMNANDDDLNFTPVTVYNFIANSRQTKKTEPCKINLSPINTTKQKNPNRNENTDFRVSKENFGGATDVYESESDLTESIYSKGASTANQKTLNNLKRQKEIILSSGSEDDIIESIPKSKRLRKRRASSMNKDSEPNNGDSTSDTDMDYNNKSSSSLSFVNKGEAIERYKNVLLPRKINANQDNSNCSDTEFLSKLNSIVQGRTSDNDSHSSDNEDSITARTIAEDVLSTLNSDKQIEYMESDVNTTNENVSVDEPTNEAFDEMPNAQSLLLQEIFNEVDNMFPSEEKNYPSCNNLLLESASDNNLFRDPPSPTSLNWKKNNNKRPVPKIDNKKMEKKNTLAKTHEPDSSFCVVDSKTNFHIGWTEEQVKFYENSWGGENFNVNKIKKSMDRNARWTIYSEDRFPKYARRSNLKCNNCSDFGHIQSRCPQPRKPVVCYMCGDTGHKEPRCPNAICLRCGSKTRMFTKMCNACAHQNKQTCSLCKLRGHSFEFCTDRWRRYHSTTSPGHTLNDTVVYNKIKFCCVCAKRGHLSQDCRCVYRFSEYPLACTEIKSHAISYKEDENLKNSSAKTVKYNLLYEPDATIQFDFSHSTDLNENKFYARFLKAVNLKFPSRGKEYTFPIAGISKDSFMECSTITRMNVETIKEEENVGSENAGTPENEDMSEGEGEGTPENEGIAKDEGTQENQGTSENQGCAENEITAEDERAPEDEDMPQSADNLVEEDMPASESNNVAPSEEIRASNHQNQNDISGKDVRDDEFKLDSDSNYSFSEHFNVKNKQTQSDERKISETYTNDSLPEYIALNDNPNNDNEMDIAEFENGITQYAISSQFQLPDDDEDERDFVLSDIPCVAKVLLKRSFSEYLLSAEGNKYLIESSMRNNVKASIEWSSVGNILIIEGLPLDQDIFHSELLVTFQDVCEKTIQKQFDENLIVPKKRMALIRFLSNDILYLKQKIGDASDLVRKLKIFENQNSNKSLKMADKTRKSLNMILYGQAGLKDGKNNLGILMQCLKNLISDTYENVANDIREKINISWKYIFSSQRNGNYEEMVDIYCDLKRNNALQMVEIDPLLFRKPQDCQDHVGNEPDQMNNVRKANNFVQPAVTKPNNNNNNNNDKLNNQKTPKLTLNNNNLVTKDPTNSFSSFLKENEKIFKIGGKTDGHSPEKNDANKVSEFWSKQAIKHINGCREKFIRYSHITEKLEVVLNNANQGLLSYNDYRSLIHLQNFIK